MNKVVHIQYSTESAGSAALRLQKALVNANMQSTIISLQVDTPAAFQTEYLGKKDRMFARIDTKIQTYLTKNTIKEYGLFSYPVLGTDVSRIQTVKEADIIYIHWALRGFLNFHSIEQLAKLNKPIILFMHDMWNITGGCHYSFGCDKYQTGCYNCQMFPGDKDDDLSSNGFKKKIKLFSKYDNFYFVTPSQWLYECTKKAFLTKDKPVFYIPNILDSTLFKPFDKTTAKRILNIDSSETVIAFGAVTINSPYKGWSYLQKALELLKQDPAYDNLLVLIFGSGYNKQIADCIPFKTKFMGYLCDEYSTSLVYNAADVFIAPSLAEAFGYVIFEALNCGTPVVGFETGGIPDIVKHKENGYLATYKNADDLAAGVKYCLQNNVKGSVLPGFESGAILNKHLELFEYITQKGKAEILRTTVTK